MIPVPEVIKREVKANPMPKNLNKNSLADIVKVKEERRQATIAAIRKEYEQNPKQRFPLATEALPSAQLQPKVVENCNKAITDQLKFNDFRPRSMPDFTKHEA